MRKIAIGGGAVAVLLWVFIALVSASTSGAPTPTGTPIDGPLTQTEICQAARLAILDRLKAPSTVKWPGNCLTGRDYVFAQEAASWTIQGQVDSQNSFGAMIRSTWQVTVLDLGDKRYAPSVDWVRP